MQFKKHTSLISRMSIGLMLIVWHQFSINPAQANCTSHSPETPKAMDTVEPLIINESLIIEDIKRAYKAIATPGTDARTAALQFGEIDTTSLNKNEVKPFNPDIESIVMRDSNNQVDSINFRFRPNSLISLSALQKAFGNYRHSPSFTSRTGSISIYTIRFNVDFNGENIGISVRRKDPSLTTERIEVYDIYIIN
jgi:hypothetical protein